MQCRTIGRLGLVEKWMKLSTGSITIQRIAGPVLLTLIHRIAINLALVVRKLDNAIQWINCYQADSVVRFVNTYPLDRIYPVDSVIQLSNNRGLMDNAI